MQNTTQGGTSGTSKNPPTKKDNKKEVKIKPSADIGKALLAANGNKSFLARAYEEAMRATDDDSQEE